MGSLFDGSGGFPLGGILKGIKPIWAAEIEPFPIRVTTKRIPEMKHYGDVSRMNGREIEPVDIITFGSPCQDMSIAGKHAGLDGARSGLFREAIRIIKEMRDSTNGRYPRFIIWENVPGAFSSNGGEDFRSVLQEICKITDSEIYVPKAKWVNSGEIVGDGYSVAWRVFDAQYWGVPQRRRRIYLVADFGSERAGEILFKPESVRRDSSESSEQGETITRDSEESTGEPSAYGVDGYNSTMSEKSSTLGVNRGMSTGRNGVITKQVIAVENHGTDSRVKLSANGIVETLTSRMGTGGNNVPLLLKIRSGCDGGARAR